MRIAIIPSLVFFLLSSISVAAYAVPASKVGDPSLSASVSEQALADVQVDKVNINTADALALQKALLGVGAAKAQAIVAHREEFGAFASVDELLEVKGIGKSILEQNRLRLATE